MQQPAAQVAKYTLTMRCALLPSSACCSGTEYTVWPVMHSYLSEKGLKQARRCCSQLGCCTA